MITTQIPASYERLETIQGDPIPCPQCASDDTWGIWDTDVSYDEEQPILLTVGEGLCKTCGHAWRI